MLKILFSTILGIILIFIWSRFVDLHQIFLTLTNVNLTVLGTVVFFMLLSLILRAIRLKIFLSEIKKIRLLDLIYLNGAAMVLNFFIPIRAGEILKGVYLNTNYQLPMAKSVIWVFIDRFVDFLVVLLLASILFFVVPTSLNITFVTIIAILLISIVILTYLIIHKADFAGNLFKFLRSLLIEKHIKIYFERFTNFILEAFSILDRHPKDLSLMIGVTVLAYCADGAIWYFTFIALGVNISFLKMLLGQVLSALTYLVPAAPGYVGSAEASGLLILSGVFGVQSNLASAMIILFHVLSAIFILIFGLISLYSLKINVRSVFKKVLKR